MTYFSCYLFPTFLHSSFNKAQNNLLMVSSAIFEEFTFHMGVKKFTPLLTSHWIFQSTKKSVLVCGLGEFSHGSTGVFYSLMYCD